MNQLITTAFAEKMSAIETETYLEERAKRGNRERFEKSLSKVSAVGPVDQDLPWYPQNLVRTHGYRQNVQHGHFPFQLP